MVKSRKKVGPKLNYKKGRRSHKKRPFVKDRPIYDRQPEETDKAWKAFQIYRDLGLARTQSKAAESYREFYGLKSKLISSERTVSEYSSMWSWRERLNAWEVHLDKQQQVLAVKEIQKMNKRHINIATSTQALAATELNKWMRQAQLDTNKDITVLTIGDVLKAIEAGVKLERSSRGEPEAIIEERHKLEVGETREGLIGLLKDPEDLAQLKALMGKLNAKPEGK